jgi:hypothetical protein
MSEDEKVLQIGQAVLDYQAAKVNVAQLEKRLASVSEAYQTFSDLLKSPSSFQSDRLAVGEFKHSDGANIPSAHSLLNRESLAGILVERENAKRRLAITLRGLRDLGITSME